MLKDKRRGAERLGLVLLLLWIVLFLGLRTLQHDSFGTNACDLSCFDYGLYSTLHGKLMDDPFHQYAFGHWHREAGRLTFEAVRSKGWENHFAIHFIPVLFLALPFTFIGGGPLLLIYLQVLLVGLAAAFLFLIARHVLHSRWAALALAAVFLFYRHTLLALMFDFHPELFFPLLLLAAFYFLAVKRKPVLYFLFVVLALAVKEEMPIYIFFFGLFAAWRLKEKKLGFITSGLALAYFILVMGVILPYYRARAGLAGFYNFQNVLGGEQDGLIQVSLYMLSHPAQLLQGLDFLDFLKKLGDLLFPLLLLPLTTTFGLLLLFPIAVALLSKLPQFYTFGVHYSASLLPFLFLALIYGLKAFRSRLASLRPERGRRIFAAVLLLLLAVNLANSNFWRIIQPSRYKALADHGRVHALLKRIPEKASVAAQSALIPHLPRRKAIFMLPDQDEADYILVHPGVNPWPYTREELATFVASLDGGNRYVLLARDGQVRLYKKAGAESP